MIRDNGANPSHYDAAYFEWQKSDGELGAVLDLWKFEQFVSPGDTVLDFGCGGGYLLASLNCSARYGVEINPVARAEAMRRVKVAANIDELPADVWFDKIISNHALEHVEDPIAVLRSLRGHLKPGGTIIVVVPSETWHKQRNYRSDDINQHLYTWTPQLLGNLFANAGYEVRTVSTLCHIWLPYTRISYRVLPSPLFHFACRMAAFFKRERQLRIVAATPCTVSGSPLTDQQTTGSADTRINVHA